MREILQQVALNNSMVVIVLGISATPAGDSKIHARRNERGESRLLILTECTDPG